MRQKAEVEEGTVLFFTHEKGGYGYARTTRRALLPAAFGDTVHFRLEDGRTVGWMPWEFSPFFAQRHGTTTGVNGSRKTVAISTPREGDRIRFVRDEPTDDGKHPCCIKWAHSDDWDAAQASINNLAVRLRVVRVVNGQIAEVLWETHNQPSGSAATLLLSARFPRAPFARDDISRSYARRGGNNSRRGQDRLFIEAFNSATAEWERVDDIRAPNRMVPDQLKARFLEYN